MASFPVALPLEIGFSRRVLMAAEVVDGVTLRPVTRGVRVLATGLRRKPLVNRSGLYVWLEEEGRVADEIVVESLNGDYQTARATPLMPPDHRRIELPPAHGYRFPPGATALRGTLRERLYGPPVPIAGADVRLQWSNDDGWNDATLSSRTAINGDFAAVLRLASTADARTLPGGDLAIRLRVEWDGAARTSDEIPLGQGAVTAWRQAFIWDELLP